MASRAYNNETRQQQQAELNDRLAQAAVRLHAQRGALATSYADIAQEAGVSLPTVYKHFPALDDLLRASTSHVGARAPALPVDEILAAPTLAQAAEILVEAMDCINAYFEPWLVWKERARIAVLEEMAAGRRKAFVLLCTGLLERHGVAGPARTGRCLGVAAQLRPVASPGAGPQAATNRCPRPPVVPAAGCLRTAARRTAHASEPKEFPMTAPRAIIAPVAPVAPDIWRISVAMPPEFIPGGFSFNQYLVVDDKPLLFHTGPKKLFGLVREQIETVMPVSESALRRVLARRSGRMRRPRRFHRRGARRPAGLQPRRGHVFRPRPGRRAAGRHGGRRRAGPRTPPTRVAVHAAFAPRVGVRLPVRSHHWHPLLRRPVHATRHGRRATRHARHSRSQRSLPRA
jgi:AcrR family transcriptional regulator